MTQHLLIVVLVITVYLAKVILPMKVATNVERPTLIVERFYNDVYYTTAYYERSVVAINASTGKCIRKYYLGFLSI